MMPNQAGRGVVTPRDAVNTRNGPFNDGQPQVVFVQNQIETALPPDAATTLIAINATLGSPIQQTGGSVSVINTPDVHVTNTPAVTISGYSFIHVPANQTTTTIKASPGVLHSVTFNSKAAATNVTTIYDNATTSGVVVGIVDATALVSPQTVIYDVAFVHGLTVITATANGPDMTFSFL